ncbi:MAG TPA: glycosyltransferase family A protein [Thermoplasmata archaeon]
MSAETTPKLASIVIPTLNRRLLLERRLPIICSAGFDEVIVVDSTRSIPETEKTRELCLRLGARYVPARLGRSAARNLGASIASAEWVFFCDDDGYVVSKISREVLRSAAQGYDALVFANHLVWIFRQPFFVALGGYRENLVAGEDDDITRRALGSGRVGSAEGIVQGYIIAPDSVERHSDQWRRLRNQLEYGMTMATFALQHPSPKSVILASIRKVGLLAKSREETIRLRIAEILMLGLGISLTLAHLLWRNGLRSK